MLTAPYALLSQRLVLTIQTCLGRIHTDKEARNITNTKRITICDLAGKTTNAKSHTCKAKTAYWNHKQYQHSKKK